MASAGPPAHGLEPPVCGRLYLAGSAVGRRHPGRGGYGSALAVEQYFGQDRGSAVAVITRTPSRRFGSRTFRPTISWVPSSRARSGREYATRHQLVKRREVERQRSHSHILRSFSTSCSGKGPLRRKGERGSFFYTSDYLSRPYVFFMSYVLFSSLCIFFELSHLQGSVGPGFQIPR